MTMPSAVAILTYQRRAVLEKMLDSMVSTVPQATPVAIFDDCSLRDNTIEWLMTFKTDLENPLDKLSQEIECDHFRILYKGRMFDVMAAKQNLGVAANSNRAIRWFDQECHGCDHLFLANDDLIFYGDAVKAYAEAHSDLEVGLFCFNNLKDDEHQWTTITVRGRKLRIFRKMTGAVMSMTRSVINEIGYFDTAFGRFGEEHCDYTNRARFKGFVSVLGRPYVCIDVEFKQRLIDHQHDVESTVTGVDKESCDAVASQVMAKKLAEYRSGLIKHPFRLRNVQWVNRHSGFDSGVKPSGLMGYSEAPANVVPFD